MQFGGHLHFRIPNPSTSTSFCSFASVENPRSYIAKTQKVIIGMSSPKAPAGHFTLLYFAAATSHTQKELDFLPAPLPLSQLYDEVDKRYPGIKQKVLSTSAVTVNLDYVDVEEETAKDEQGLVIKEGDEVAIIPPVSSG
ncbi:Molybdopterin synthase sulfur carrier subunit [Pseudocercospora fuligena]|uniref:Molybdopterin synthase sulfur carrier subunit n=1 Tax=Pseudocercospora fuligena TaxID=685502 RepID=A0A8H6RBN7_9PEZI|nr:Molybdopterin synthase sulfur carrier subunit [Pseudocercospora fuligena]